MKARKTHDLSPARSPPSDAESGSKDADRFLPIANVSRIIKRSLPANAKVSKEAKEVVQECVSEFISFITGEASDKCQREKRKTINGEDLLWSMTTLGFESYVPSLKLYLNKCREVEGGENSSAAMQGDHSPADEAGDDQSVFPTGFSGFNGGVYTVAPAAPPIVTHGSGAYSMMGGAEENHGGTAWTVPGSVNGLQWFRV